jgi:hypothetical protein
MFLVGRVWLLNRHKIFPFIEFVQLDTDVQTFRAEDIFVQLFVFLRDLANQGVIAVKHELFNTFLV